MVLPSERVLWVNKHDVCMYVCMQVYTLFLLEDVLPEANRQFFCQS